MEKLLKICKDKTYDFGFLFKEWEKLINSIDNKKSTIIKSRKLNKSIPILEDIIKKIASENNLIKICNQKEGVDFLYQKIKVSILKDFLINDRECEVLSIYLFNAIILNLDSFANVLYILEKIIKNVFEDCNISTFTQKGLDNNLMSLCSTNLIEQLNEKNKYEKISRKYPCIGVLRYTHAKTYEGKQYGQDIRTCVMKKNTYNLYDINFRMSLIFIALFILSLIKMPKRYNFKKKENSLLKEKKIDFLAMNSERFSVLLKDIENQDISLTYENISDIQSYIFENNIECNIIELRNKMNLLIKKEIISIRIDDKGFYELNIEPYLKNNNVSETIDIYKNLYKGMYSYEEKLTQYINYTAGNMGKIYHFKNEEEKKKYVYMMLLHRYFTGYVKCENLHESELICVLNERGKNLTEDDKNKIMSALLNGLNGSFYNCLILHSVISKKIGGQKNKRNKTKEENKEVEFIDFFSKQIRMFEQMRHGDFAINELEYFGFTCFVVSIMIFFN